MYRAEILSTGSYLPGEPIENGSLEVLAGPLAPQVAEGIQVRRRHWLADPVSGEHKDTNSDMAANAARQALNRADLQVDTVDLLVTCTSSPEYMIPSMGALLQDKLGLERCTSLEIRGGCAGAMEAIDIARLYLERGSHGTALVVCSEAISPALVSTYLGKDPLSIRMRDRMALYLFGDGAGAVILRRTEHDTGILGTVLRSVGGGKRPGLQVIGGGTHAPLHQQIQSQSLQEIRMNVGDIDRNTPHLVADAIAETLEAAGVSAESIDVCVLPEGGEDEMTDDLERAGRLTPQWNALRGKIVENTALVGATGAAAVPLALDDAWVRGRLRPGDRVMVIAIEITKWIYGGMVVTWTTPARNEVDSGFVDTT